jgi:hypothetical protein
MRYGLAYAIATAALAHQTGSILRISLQIALFVTATVSTRRIFIIELNVSPPTLSAQSREIPRRVSD